jgi:hypothetical protein
MSTADVHRHLAWERLADEMGHDGPGRELRWGLSEVQVMIVDSALLRQDYKRAAQAIRDFTADNRRPQVRISKFSPGEHYYVFREKFASYEEAKRHAEGRGYRVLPGIDVQSMNDLILAARAAKADRQE